MLLIMKILQFIFAFIFLFRLHIFAQKGASIALTGRASFYAEDFHGKRTASGEKFDVNKYTGAHRTLPFGTKVKVTNLLNGKSVILKINDRGPHVKTRIIDVSKCAARAIDLIKYGAAKVSIEVVSDPLLNLGPYLPNRLPNEVLNTALYLPGHTYNFWGFSRKIEGFGFQVGAFTDLISAREVCQQFIQKGIQEVYIQVAALPEGNLYRVLAYRFDTRQQAESELHQVKSMGLQGFVRSY